MVFWRRFVNPSSGRCLIFVIFMSTLDSRISAARCYHPGGGVPAPRLKGPHLKVLIEEAEQSSHNSANGPKRRRAKREYVGQDAASRDELETENPTESACASDGETERAERA